MLFLFFHDSRRNAPRFERFINSELPRKPRKYVLRSERCGFEIVYSKGAIRVYNITIRN